VADGPWVQCAVAAESRVTVKELIARHRYWFRVRAISGKGEGDWSDPVTKYSR
jgi:Fibronectin type III domain